jgi:hypothetical protein
MFGEVSPTIVCPPPGPDPALMWWIGVAIGIWIGIQIVLIYVKINGDPFYKEDELEEDH